MSFFGALISGRTFDGILISGSSLDVFNRYIDINFDPNVYHSTGGGLLASDLQVVFNQNGGVATACSISSITKTSGGALVGGENIVRVNLTITGNPSGIETIEIKPSASGSYKDSFNQLCSYSDSTGEITLETELDPLYKAGLTTALNNSITIPGRDKRLVDNALFTTWRSAGILSGLDGLRICNNLDPDFIKIEFITGALTGSITGTPTIEQFKGVKGNSSTIDIGYAPLTNGVNYTQNDASIIQLVYNDTQGTGRSIGVRGSTSGVNFGHSAILPRSTSDQATAAININSSGNSNVHTLTNSAGVHHVARTASNLTTYYKDGSSIGTASTASSTRSDKNFYLCSENQNGSIGSSDNSHQIAVVAWGASLSAKVSDVNSALQTFKTDSEALIQTFSGKLYSWCGQSNMNGGRQPLTDLSPSDALLYNNGPMSIANGYDANCYVWWNDQWEFLEAGENGVNGSGADVSFSPIFPFAYAESLKYPGEDLFFIVGAQAGTWLQTPGGANQWLTGGVVSSPWALYKSNYDAAVASMTSITYMPFYWGQGEAESSNTDDGTMASQYETNEQSFVTQVLAQTGHTDLIVMQIHSGMLASNYPYLSTVRTAKSNNLSNGEYGTSGDLISIDDLTIDSPHLIVESQITFAQRMSTAF